MARIEGITVPVTFKMTEESEQAIKALIARCLRQALGDDESAVIPFVTMDALRDFVRAEVHKALKELLPQVDEHVREQIDHRVTWYEQRPEVLQRKETRRQVGGHEIVEIGSWYGQEEPPHLLTMDLSTVLPHFVRRDALNGGLVLDMPLTGKEQ